MIKKIALPLSGAETEQLHAGDVVTLSGTVYTARDAAHKRMLASLEAPPFDIRDACVYYCGPAPAKKGEIIGSCGPTTSARMDDFTPELLRRGLKAMIGKGKRTAAVNAEIAKYKAVYFAAVGGAAALIESCVKQCELVAYPDLGCEAIYRLHFEDLPLVVATDCRGVTILK